MTDRFDIDAFEERAAICEFCAGMSRFDAETMAAHAQGVARYQALQFAKEATNANGRGSVSGHGHPAHPLDGGRNADDLPGMQRRSEKEDRPMPERQPQAGRDRGEMLALRLDSGAAL